MASNCKNCGGVYEIGSVACPYCGTINDDFVSIMEGKPVNISFTHDGTEYTFKFLLTDFQLQSHANRLDMYYADDALYHTFSPMTYMASFDGTLLPMNVEGREGVMFMTRRK